MCATIYYKYYPTSLINSAVIHFQKGVIFLKSWLVFNRFILVCFWGLDKILQMSKRRKILNYTVKKNKEVD